MGAVSSRPRVVVSLSVVCAAVVGWVLAAKRRARKQKAVGDVGVQGRNDDEEPTADGEQTRCINNDKGEAEMLACKELLFGPTRKHGTIDLARPDNFPDNFLFEDARGYKNNRGQTLQLLTRPAIHQIFGWSTPQNRPLFECYRSIYEADGPVVRRAREDPAISGVDDERLANAIDCLGRSVTRRHRQRRCRDWTRCICNHCKMLRTLAGCQGQLADELASRENRARVAAARARREQERREAERQEAVPEPGLDSDTWGAEPEPEPVITGGDEDEQVKDSWDSSEDDEEPAEDEQAFLDRLDERSRQQCDQETAPENDAAWTAEDQTTRGGSAPNPTISKRSSTFTRQEVRRLLPLLSPPATEVKPLAVPKPGAWSKTLADCDGRFRCLKEGCEQCSGNLRETGYPEGRKRGKGGAQEAASWVVTPGRNDSFKQHLYNHVFADAKAAIVELGAVRLEADLETELRDERGRVLKRDEAIKRLCLPDPPAACTALLEARSRGLCVSGTAATGLTVEFNGKTREFEPTDYAICGDLLTEDEPPKRHFGLCAPTCKIGASCQGEARGWVRFLPPVAATEQEMDDAGLPA